MKYHLDHVSVLVNSIENSEKLLSERGIEIGKREIFSDTGTEESYIGNLEYTALLLVQAVMRDGPYKRALDKRGPGIHHIAIATDDFDAFNEKLSSLGWFVHPESFKGYKKGKTVFYIRPGVKTILELVTAKELDLGPQFITDVSVEVESGKEKYIEGIGLPGLTCSSKDEAYIVIQGKKWSISTLSTISA